MASNAADQPTSGGAPPQDPPYSSQPAVHTAANHSQQRIHQERLGMWPSASTASAARQPQGPVASSEMLCLPHGDTSGADPSRPQTWVRSDPWSSWPYLKTPAVVLGFQSYPTPREQPPSRDLGSARGAPRSRPATSPVRLQEHELVDAQAKPHANAQIEEFHKLCDVFQHADASSRELLLEMRPKRHVVGLGRHLVVENGVDQFFILHQMMGIVRRAIPECYPDRDPPTHPRLAAALRRCSPSSDHCAKTQ